MIRFDFKNLTNGAIPHDAAGKPVTQSRHHTFFVGSDVRAAIKHGMAEYLPISVAHVPELFNVGRIALDVALIQVSLPDRFGYMSLRRAHLGPEQPAGDAAPGAHV